MQKNIDVSSLCALSRLSLNSEQRIKITNELEEFARFARVVLEYEHTPIEPGADKNTAMREDIAKEYESKIADGYIEVPLTVGAEE